MTARKHLLCCLLLVVAVPVLAQTPPQRDPRAAAPGAAFAPVTGTGVIAGTITAGDTSRPMRRVRLTLSNSETNASVGTAVTDTQGRFTFSNLPAAPFTLRAFKTGYLDVTYGQKKLGSGRPGTSIVLADGQRIQDVALQMPRGGVVSGTVVDEVGDPVFGVPVRVWRFVMRSGVRELAGTSGLDTTDDRGQFRVSGLIPGEYVVCAQPRDEFVQAALQYEVVAARMQEIRAAGGGPPNVRDGAGQKPEDPKEAYVTVCFPNTTQMSAGASITVDIAEEKSGHGLQLQLLPIARVSGKVSWSGGQLPFAANGQGGTSDTQVHLVDLSSSYNPSVTRVIHVKSDGTFSFANVPPGQYSLEAHADVPIPQTASATPPAPGQRPPGPQMTPLWASLPIAVNGEPLNELPLAMAHGQTVSGRVVAEGAVDMSQIRLTAHPTFVTFGEFNIPTAIVESDGRFTITGVVPGRFKIGLARAAAGAAIKSSIFGGVDSQDFPIEIKGGENIAGGVVTVIPRLGEIAGQLQNASNQPATGFTVIAFSTDTKFWTPTSRRIQSARPATDGRFSLKNLPAGEYRLAAVSDVEAGQWFDPAFLREITAGSTTVTLAEGERKDQLLRFVK